MHVRVKCMACIAYVMYTMYAIYVICEHVCDVCDVCNVCNDASMHDSQCTCTCVCVSMCMALIKTWATPTHCVLLNVFRKRTGVPQMIDGVCCGLGGIMFVESSQGIGSQHQNPTKLKAVPTQGAMETASDVGVLSSQHSPPC